MDFLIFYTSVFTDRVNTTLCWTLLMYPFGNKGDPDGLGEFLANGGQRLAQCIVYLNSLSEAQEGQTAFHDKELGGLEVTPKKGCALVFFPSFRDGMIDERMTHSGRPPKNAEKWIIGTWLCQTKVPAWNQQ